MAPFTIANDFIEGLELSTEDVVEGICNLSKTDFLLSLAPGDPVITKLGWTPPEDIGAVRKTQLLQYAKAADCYMAHFGGMPFLEAYKTILQLSYETCTSSCNPNRENRLRFLDTLKLRRNKYEKGATTEELVTFKKLLDYLLKDSNPLILPCSEFCCCW